MSDAPRYKMPPAERGDIVWWYPGGEMDPKNAQAALVGGVSGDTLQLNILYAGGKMFVCRDRVRHASDPWFDKYPEHRKDEGVWDYSPMLKRLMALEAALSDLTKTPKGK